MNHLGNLIRNSTLQSIFFGMLILLVFALIWNPPIKRYKIDLQPFEKANLTSDVHWIAGDFNGDGNSERIRVHNGISESSLSLVHYDSEGYITDHYHITGSEWNYNLRPAVFDIDKDNKQELLFFTVRNDSVFFNVFSLYDFKLKVDHLFVDSFEQKRNEYAYCSEFYQFGDFDGNGTNEVLCRFDAGFGLYPRGIFKIEFPSLKISRSQSEYMVLHAGHLSDITRDGIPEILCNCTAPANTAQYKKYSDTISYISVLDQDLKFLFAPIAFPGEFSTVQCLPDAANDTLFYACFYPRSKSKIPFSVYVVNNKGKILNSKIWENVQDSENFSKQLLLINGKSYLCIQGCGSFLLTPDLSLLPDKIEANINKMNKIPFLYDLDDDGSDEWITVEDSRRLSIFNEQTNEKAEFESPRPIVNRIAIYPWLRNGKRVKYLMDTAAGFFYFRYQRNPLYFVLYLIYLGVFVFSSCTIWLILYWQRKAIEQKWQAGKQLSELQFNAIKNQLNPHFLFNALNSVAYMIHQGETNEAYDFLNLNSRMIQRVMNDANEVKRPLSVELQFTQDYIQIQKHRFKERFDYTIKVHPNVNTGFEIPKMCIHTYVENAIKHGFTSIKSGGILAIEIEPFSTGLFISISDNGSGRKASQKSNPVSGNGIRIMNEFYRLFEMYYGYKISCRISNPLEGSGTIVHLHIQR